MNVYKILHDIHLLLPTIYFLSYASKVLLWFSFRRQGFMDLWLHLWCWGPLGWSHLLCVLHVQTLQPYSNLTGRVLLHSKPYNGIYTFDLLQVSNLVLCWRRANTSAPNCFLLIFTHVTWYWLPLIDVRNKKVFQIQIGSPNKLKLSMVCMFK